jgi:hypothetical protein
MPYFSYENTGIARDITSVTPNDSTDNVPAQCIGLYAGSSGDVVVITENDTEITIPVASLSPLYVAIKRVKATGTTASNIFALSV